jgi:cyclopropane fatty-acyl-phospholipid synthase-like methyltransferase
MTEHDNFIEYSDPEIYDLENQDFEQDEAFILSYAQKPGGTVLELGCGTGRVTIPLARRGVDIAGVDVVSEMVERGRQKSKGLPIEWIVADIRTLQLGRKFKLIFELGSVFHHMLTRQDQEAFLARAREHLAEDGQLITSLFFPHPGRLASTEAEETWYTVRRPDGIEIHVSGIDHYDALRQIRTETAYRRWTNADGQENLRVAPLSLRTVFPQEMETLLYYNGFEIVEQYGGTDFSPLSNDSSFQVYICRKRK